MKAKRDCLFYAEYQDMGARVDICTVKGNSMDALAEGCRCDECPNYYSLNWMRCILRQSIKEREREVPNDTNKII